MTLEILNLKKDKKWLELKNAELKYKFYPLLNMF